MRKTNDLAAVTARPRLWSRRLRAVRRRLRAGRRTLARGQHRRRVSSLALAALAFSCVGGVSGCASTAASASAAAASSKGNNSSGGNNGNGKDSLFRPSAGSGQVGTASWHAPRRGSSASRTASGRTWAMDEMVAAHRRLPLGSRALVTNTRTRQHCVVQIIDRGPYVGGRIIDVSKAAASQLGLIGSGTGRVRVDPIPADVSTEAALSASLLADATPRSVPSGSSSVE